MKRICITGSFGNKDIGDDAMLEEHLRHLKQWGVGREQITLIGHIPGYMTDYFDHPRELCKSSRLIRQIDPTAFDCLIVTGGGTINDRPGSRSLQRINGLVSPFLKARVPVFMSGQTIGPLSENTTAAEMARKLCSSVDVLTVRDRGFSRWFLSLIGCDRQDLIESRDDAWNLPAIVPKLWPVEKERDVVAVSTTRYLTDSPANKSIFLNLLKQIPDRLLLVSHAPEDHEFLHEVEREIPGSCFWDTTAVRAGEIKYMVGMCRAAVGGRYHFGVFARSMGVPTVMLSGSMYSMVKNLGLQSWSSNTMVLPVDTGLDWRMIQGGLLTSPASNAFELKSFAFELKSFQRLHSWLRSLGVIS